MNKFLLSFYKRVVEIIYSSVTPVTRSDIDLVITRIDIWYQSRGPVWTADRVKLCRLAVTRYLCGHPLTEPAGLSLTKDGLPRVLPHGIRSLIRQKDLRAISLALTLLSVSRSILGGKPVDYGPITEPSSAVISKDLRSFIAQEIKLLGFNRPGPLGWESFHWSTKSGPNGPALQYSLVDYINLPESLKTSILTLAPQLKIPFGVLEEWSNRPGLWSILSKVFQTSRNPGRIRKLSVKPDREAKSRVFAILDYWSQTALRPLHLKLFQMLKVMGTDCTFNQDHGVTLRAAGGQSYHSLDLSSATDRFPVDLQVFVLEQIIGKEKAAAWKDIMVGYAFETPEGNSVTYATGQPMGAHSSWPLFTLTHHLIVQYSNMRAGLPAPFRDYRILGDDIVIANDAVAAEYKKVITHELGVSISEAKSHVSKDTFEIAKRWVHQDSEITPFPVMAFFEVHSKFHLVADLWKTTLTRGFEYLGEFGTTSLREILYAAGHRGRLLHRDLRNIRAFLLLLGLPHEETSPDKVDRIQRFLELIGASFPCNWRDATIAKMFDDIASSCYYETQERLADRARDRVRRWQLAIITDIEEHPDLGPDDQSALTDHWKEALPMLAALSDKSAESLATVMSSIQSSYGPSYLVWKKLSHTKVMALPSDSGVIPIRSAHLKAGARAIMVKDLRLAILRFLNRRSSAYSD